jgi:NADP-dependent 3-hydroxy acid dehydrogenase YdfG
MESNITKIAFITVATSGIGAAFAKKFAEQGF